MLSRRVTWVGLGLWGWLGWAVSGWAQDVAVSVRFEDAETGLSVASARVTPESPTPMAIRAGVDGRSQLRARPGRHALTVGAPGYQSLPVTLDVEAGAAGAEGGGRPIIFRLTPEVRRVALELARILARTRPDSTLVTGYVGDEESGAPLEGVRVAASPSGAETWTDATGFFELWIPLPGAGERGPVSMSLERAGYRSEVREHLELWAGGDWTYRLRLSQGEGERRTDERATRRRGGDRSSDAEPAMGEAGRAEVEGRGEGPSVEVGEVVPPMEPGLAAAGVAGGVPGGVVVRVPRTIRVLHTNAVFFETLENYCRHVLPAEWFSSWGSYPGGSNSLQAGAVALRTYAIGYVNQPSAAGYDICSTTACQVYNPAVSSSRADLAVAATAGFVMVDASGGIPRGLTQYSAENNQLGMSCGDGFTAPVGGCLADPVCAGEVEFGHGRGMCQWGTVKWATGLKFPGNNFSDTTRTNGQPPRDWGWIAAHYYPGLTLVQGRPLGVGDGVRATVASLTVRRCAGNTISNGVNCPSAGTVSAGTTGLIVSGPVWVQSDGSGYTWWEVQWSTGLTGWAVENYLARVPPPVVFALGPIPDQRIDEGQSVRWTAKLASGPGHFALATFEEFVAPPPNGAVLFRAPGFSGTTSGFLDSTPNASSVTGAFPSGTAGQGGERVLGIQWSFRAESNAWLRLTTQDASTLSNPVIDLTRRLRFDVYATRAVRIGLGVRETTNASGTVPGLNGGTNGPLEWVGVTGVVNGQPQPVRTVPAGAWVTLTFDLPAEPVIAIVGNGNGDGVLSTASGLGVLEHLAIVPAEGAGTYRVWVDDLAVDPRTLSFSLEPGAPDGAAINSHSGEFEWTPGEAQGPATHVIGVRVTDAAASGRSALRRWTNLVDEINEAPVFVALADPVVHSGTQLRLTNGVVDVDQPRNRLTFSPATPPLPAGAVLDPFTGVLTWGVPEVFAETVQVLAIRVVDDGSPSRETTRAISVRIHPRMVVTAAWDAGGSGGLELRWNGIPGRAYRVQSSAQVAGAEWLDLGSVVVAGDSGAFVRLLAPSGPGFYRVREED